MAESIPSNTDSVHFDILVLYKDRLSMSWMFIFTGFLMATAIVNIPGTVIFLLKKNIIFYTIKNVEFLIFCAKKSRDTVP
jgi:hypothetical protein